MGDALLAIEQGVTSTREIVFGRGFRSVWLAYQEMLHNFPLAGSTRNPRCRGHTFAHSCRRASTISAIPAAAIGWQHHWMNGEDMADLKVKLDHSVVHVSDRERSDKFYRDVLGAELVGVAAIRMYRFGDAQLNVHGPGLDAKPVARVPVPPGGSDICFEWPGPIEEAVAHLARCGVPIDCGPQRGFGARGLGDSVYFRDPDGTLLEFICYRDD